MPLVVPIFSGFQPTFFTYPYRMISASVQVSEPPDFEKRQFWQAPR